MKYQYIVTYSIIFTVLNYLLSSVYRPYIYSQDINDYGLADVGNNVIFVPGIYFIVLLIRKKPFFNYNRDIYFHTVILIIVEILSKYYNGIGTFDYKDIIGLALGGSLTFLIVKPLIKPANLN